MDRRRDDKNISFGKGKITGYSQQLTDCQSNSEEKILVAGFGGQGIMLLGRIIARAAAQENKFTTWIPSYGAEMRGGTAHCFVKISSRAIASPIFEYPTVLLTLNQPSWDKFTKKIRNRPLIIVNASLVKPSKQVKAKVIELPLNEVAIKIGSLKIANIITLGVFVKNKPTIVKLDTVEAVLKETFSQKRELLNLNLKAFHWGIENG